MNILLGIILINKWGGNLRKRKDVEEDVRVILVF